MSNIPIIIFLSAGASFCAAFISRHLARRLGALDEPTGGRKIHEKPIPLFGGVGIGVTIIAIVAGFIVLGLNDPSWLGRNVSVAQLFGFAIGLAILLTGGILDDLWDLPPRLQIFFPVAAALSLIITGTRISLLTNWAGGPPFSLGIVSAPLTLLWLLIVTYATKFMDGVDGLVAGQAVIGAVIIALLSLTTPFYLPLAAFLALAIAGSFLGFLPHNFYPAKQFLGEAGSAIAGFSLGFLAILGSAKLATGLMVLGFPLIDAVVVIFGRLGRGASPFQGDDTHLHFKLLRAGLSQRQTVFLIWTISLAFGLAALGLQTTGKIILLITLSIITAAISYLAGRRSRFYVR